MHLPKGLTQQDVQQRINQGAINTLPKPDIKTNGEIIRNNICTLFNLFNLVIAIALILVGAYSSILFMGVIISNTAIFIVQEIRSRNLVQKLNILITPHTKVVRDDSLIAIENEHIVLDDIVCFEAGNQISCDSSIISGFVEVNESLLTGEIDPIDKQPGDVLLSGSFVISGTCFAKVTHVGNDNYASKVTQSVKTERVISSDLLNTFTSVTKLTSYFIIPIGALLMTQSLLFRHETLYQSVVNTASALLGMLPQGLVLLTTLTLMSAVLKLGARKSLVQDLYAIETLSQIDVLCLDKTGTLTQGQMEVMHVEHLHPQFETYVSAYIHASSDNNATMLALRNEYRSDQSLPFDSIIPFASSRKWGAINFSNGHTFIIGAPDILLPSHKLSAKIQDFQNNGARILCAALSDTPIAKDHMLPQLEAMAFVAIEDPLRPDAKEAITYFQDNGVAIKIISGDNIVTVGAIAKRAGVDVSTSPIDATTLTTPESMADAIMQTNVIGRATPQQKLDFMEILQENKNRVAMTGDGINDVMALKRADVSIALGEGSDAALNISQIVIMDGKLTTLVDVVKEGRQVINNITRSASMFYLRTILTIFIAIFAILLNVSFPFIPLQVTLTNIFIGGLPSFLIMFEVNHNKPTKTVIQHVMQYAFPNALAIIIMWLALIIFRKPLHLNSGDIQSLNFFVNAFLSFYMLYRIFKPLNKYRTIILIVDIIGFAIATLIAFPLLEIVNFTTSHLVILAVIIGCCIPLVEIIRRTVVKIQHIRDQRN
ncbi:HAD-IC family P-type ATPase [Erysipelothrix sp. HDW6C]|uniref:HAD-IC family P-type ATPase n=1 Tax=Erysipelothrix sp. HDW6C TaxID=2714930 RepID=UPI00140E2EF9|nr:HAD-IC family P-type ATPase [Erysipelothrix sp. HDW6C]QIK69765.1 HAD-IC family P-type ATPase [Erysipelothrix sp. HDW6C]